MITESDKTNIFVKNYQNFQQFIRNKLSSSQKRDTLVVHENFKLTANLRGHWSLRIDFILTCIGFAVGIGNIWRFPFKVLSNGGGSFVIAYVIMLYIMATPLFFLEVIISQFSSRGVTECWNFAAGLSGIGYTMLIISLFCSIYYNVIVSWSIYFFVNSFRYEFPWVSCSNWWNDNKCIRSNFSGILKLNQSFEMSSEQFWLRNVITRIKTIDRNSYKVYELSDNPETIVWYTCLCLLTTWVICGAIMMYGIKISGKSMWAFVTYPYLVLTIMIIIGSQLDGSYNGLKYYFQIDFKRLIDLKVWHAAAEQIFFSLGVGFGSLLTFGSYNGFHENLQSDVIIISTINGATSLYGGLAVFQLLGHMSYRYEEPFTEMSKYGGDGLIFIAYPEVLSTFKGGHVLCILFFSMVFSLGIDSQIGIIETVITGILDMFPNLRQRYQQRIILVWVFNLFSFLAGLIMVTKTGFLWFNLFSNYAASTNLLVVGFFECVAVVYIYGINNLNRDYKMMHQSNLNYYWRFCMLIPIPIITLILAIYDYIHSTQTAIGHGYHKIVFPLWGDILGWIIAIFTILPIPGYLIYFVYEAKTKKGFSLSDSFYLALTPNMNWGPGSEDEWKASDFYNEKLEIFKSKTDFMFSVIEPSNV